MVQIVTIAEVRAISGAPSSLIDDTTVSTQIDLVQEQTRKKFEIEFFPTTAIETLTGNLKDKIMVQEQFPLTVFSLFNGDTEIDAENIYVHTENGIIELYGDTSVSSQFGNLGSRFSNFDLDIKIKYLFGVVERNRDVQSETTATIAAGTTVSVDFIDASNFAVNDFVFIEDLNQQKEVAKITVISTNTVTFERLVNSYESGALVTKAKTHELVRSFVLYEAALAVAVNAIGSTFSVATSYSVPELTVVKGVPWTHWANNFDRNQKLRNEILTQLRQLLGSIV